MLYFDNVYLVLLSCVPLLQLVLIDWVNEITSDLVVLLLCYRTGKLQYWCTFRSWERHRKWRACNFWILFSDFALLLVIGCVYIYSFSMNYLSLFIRFSNFYARHIRNKKRIAVILTDMQVLLHNILELVFGCVCWLHTSVTSWNVLIFSHFVCRCV
jgi:hypothetical protein